MTAWMVWLALAGMLVILEMFSGTFYLLMIALGMVAGALAAWLGLSAEIQILLAALVGAAAALALRRRRPRKSDAARDPNINLDIGQSLHVSHWHEGTARAMYRGALWDVELAHGAHARTGQFVIREVRGSRLIVSNQPE
ncbi:MAG TPA: NfeD family protein [Noviherbaspirillum sp.]|jgi:membrane protein implicated in regulation of membrane protease activity